MRRFLHFIIVTLLPLWIVCSSVSAYFFPDTFIPIREWPSFALAFILFTMGLTLSIDSLKKVISKPKNAFLGVLGKWTITLGISFLLATLFFANHPELKAGVLLAGAVPSGTTANLYTFMAGGTLALSIMMSAVDTLIGPFLTPLLMKVTINSTIPIDALSMFKQMVLVVLVPIALGLFIQYKWEHYTVKVKPILPYLSSVAIIIINLAIVSSAQGILEKNISLLPLIFFCVFLQIMIPMILGYIYGIFFNMPKSDRISMFYEFGICNTALASILAMHHISPIAAVPAVANMITNTFLGALIAIAWKPLSEKWESYQIRKRAILKNRNEQKEKRID
ncbi:bile acid:sodium symporter family protein [Peribacillus sp. Hz7]|uniref:bile acid:sodium symporter family protein n=1 Tax=Peribacillus sp. Hz7 TaxID=3344873 RepID=UPI0035CA0B6F